MITSECIYWAVLQLQESVKRAPAASISSRVSRRHGPPSGGGCHRRRSCCAAGQWRKNRWEQGWGHGRGPRCLFIFRALEIVATGDWVQYHWLVHQSKQSCDNVYNEMLRHSTDSFWGTRCQSLDSSFHSTHTRSHTDICSSCGRSRSAPHKTLWNCRLSVWVWHSYNFY